MPRGFLPAAGGAGPRHDLFIYGKRAGTFLFMGSGSPGWRHGSLRDRTVGSIWVLARDSSYTAPTRYPRVPRNGGGGTVRSRTQTGWRLKKSRSGPLSSFEDLRFQSEPAAGGAGMNRNVKKHTMSYGFLSFWRLFWGNRPGTAAAAQFSFEDLRPVLFGH